MAFLLLRTRYFTGPSAIRGDEQEVSREVTRFVFSSEKTRNASIEMSDIWSHRDVDTPSPFIIDALQDSIDLPSAVPTDEAVAEFVGLPSIDDISQVNISFTPPPLSNLQPARPSAARVKSRNACTHRLLHQNSFGSLLKKEEKVFERSGKRKPRRLGRSLIATDTPEKEEIKSYKTAIKRKKGRRAIVQKYIRKVLKSD